jgi:flagellar basal-body rod protein FlgB
MAVSTIKNLEHFLSYCSVKNKVIGQNIANIATENYKRKDVEFRDIFNENCAGQLYTDNEKHLVSKNNSSEEPYSFSNDPSRDNISGINNVDIEKEMSELAENSIYFKFASKKIGDYYKSLESVIKGTNS